MRRLTILVALAFALSVGVTEAAKPKTISKPSGAGKPTVTKTQAPKGGAAQGSSVKTKGASAKTTKSPSVKAKGVEAKATKTTTTSVKAAKTDTKATTTTATVPSTTTTTTDSIDFAATSLGQKLQRNSTQRSKIEAKLLAAGYTGTIYEAAYGFKNLGQLNAATNMVQNHGTSFELLKVLMTGTYVDPVTQQVYRANQLPDGTVQLVSPELATNPVSSLSLGQAKQAVTGGALMPVVVPYTTTTTTTTTTSSK
jgi:hypothetical protein